MPQVRSIIRHTTAIKILTKQIQDAEWNLIASINSSRRCQDKSLYRLWSGVYQVPHGYVISLFGTIVACPSASQAEGCGKPMMQASANLNLQHARAIDYPAGNRHYQGYGWLAFDSCRGICACLAQTYITGERVHVSKSVCLTS